MEKRKEREMLSAGLEAIGGIVKGEKKHPLLLFKVA